MMRTNKFLRDRMLKRGDYANDRTRREEPRRDMRNPYGSKGGYVDSSSYPDSRDFQRRDRRMRDRAKDYHYDEDYNDYDELDERDMQDMNMEYNEDLEKLNRKLMKKDKMKISPKDLINNAKQMGVKFDEYSETEFLTAYYLMQSLFPDVAHEHHRYLVMAKSFLENDLMEVDPSEMLSIFYYKIIKGE